MLTIKILKYVRLNCVHKKILVTNQFVLTKCCYRFCHVSPDNKHDEHKTSWENILGCSNEESISILTSHTFLNELDNTRIKKTANILERFGITKADIRKCPKVLTLLPASIEHRGMILQEGGFININVKLLLKYLIVVKMRISLIKAYGLISPNTDVASTFITHFDHVPPEITQNILCDIHEGNQETFISVYGTVLKHLLAWRLDITLEDIDNIMITYPRIKHKSFRQVSRSLNILENEIGFSKKKISKNGYLIHSHIENTLNTLHKVKTLGGIDIKTVLRKHPKILMTSTNTLIKTSNYLKEFNIADEAVQRCLDVFTLGSESVRQRLLELNSIPEFQALTSHPRILRLVHYQHKAKSRLDHLQELRVRCVSLHILSSTRAKFERYARDGEDRTRGTDATLYLANELGVAESTLRPMLVRHPFWRHIPLVAIRSTLEYLLALGYSADEVLHNIHIILYPRDRVEQELKNLTAHEELTVEQLTVPSVLTGDCRLALCLYFIERTHHFTGDGVWTIQTTTDTDTIILDPIVSVPETVTQ